MKGWISLSLFSSTITLIFTACAPTQAPEMGHPIEPEEPPAMGHPIEPQTPPPTLRTPKSVEKVRESAKPKVSEEKLKNLK
ncbi:hypothetical protein [Nitratifractor sp.]